MKNNTMDLSDDSLELLRAKINLETSKIPWRELQTHFARGMVLHVSTELDLIAVALSISRNCKQDVEQWIAKKWLVPVPDEQALEWVDADATVWAVVTKPWILVQSLA